MNAVTKQLSLDFSIFRGGMNSKDPHISIGDNQAFTGSKNAIFKKSGFSPWFAFHGIKSSAVFTGKIRGLDIYTRVSGEDILIGFKDGNVYQINKISGELTLLHTLSGSGECYAVSMYDKLFVANGTDSCVIEGSNGYSIGIAPPSGVIAAAAAGGSLPDGDYIVYASYARIVSESNVQYSQGQLLGTVTLGSGNNTIAITNFADSSDSRVGNKIIWMTDADGGDIYFYYETEDNTTTAFNITDNSQRDTSLYYRIWSESSAQPPVMTGIFGHDDRIFGWKDNVLYASMQAVTVYDLERWPEIKCEFPFQISSLFSIGADLYINSTNQGVFKLPNADMAGQYKQISKRLWFKYPRTIQNTDENFKETPSPVIGVTNDGVRIFDGNNFTIDLSMSIKNDITDLYNDADINFMPAGIVCRSKDRTEYRFSYRDKDLGAVSNNNCYVLNMDELSIISNVEYNAPWENVSIGFNYACIDYTGKLFMAQSLDSGSQVFIENRKSSVDTHIYNADGDFITDVAKHLYVVSKMVIPSIAGRNRFEQLRYISYMRSSSTIKLVIGENTDINETSNVDTGAQPLFGVAVFGVDRFASSEPIIGCEKLGMDLKGVSIYMIFECNSSSYRDYISEIKVFGTYEQGRMV